MLSCKIFSIGGLSFGTQKAKRTLHNVVTKNQVEKKISVRRIGFDFEAQQLLVFLYLLTPASCTLIRSVILESNSDIVAPQLINHQ